MAKSRERVGHGIFGWDGTERRTDRYGAFVVGQRPYGENVSVAAHLDVGALRRYVGKRVHLWCQVVANRESGHVGDLFLGIKPSKPEVGEVVDLGVGVLALEPGFDGLTAVVLQPGDGRDRFWIDPRKLYRLHDQTVDVFVEPTKKDYTAAPDLSATSDPDSIENGDGSFQVKGVENGETFRVPADIERLGPGLFVLNQPSGLEAGRRRKLVRG